MNSAFNSKNHFSLFTQLPIRSFVTFTQTIIILILFTILTEAFWFKCFFDMIPDALEIFSNLFAEVLSDSLYVSYSCKYVLYGLLVYLI